jgi:hypothetical protein
MEAVLMKAVLSEGMLTGAAAEAMAAGAAAPGPIEGVR